MAKSVFIPRQHLVMATERTPAGFRPGNQAVLEPTQATNPRYANTDAAAFMPGMGQCRSGNGASDLGLGGKWLAQPVAVSGLGITELDRQKLMAATNARNIAAAPPKEVPPVYEYQDANGKVITQAEYITLMTPPKPPPPIYKDAQGNVITKEQFDQLNALVKAAQTPPYVPPKPKVVVKKLPKAGVHGLGDFPSTSTLLIGAAVAYGVYLAMKRKKAKR